MKIISLGFAFLLGLGLQSFTANSNATVMSGDEKTAFVPLEDDLNDDELRKLLKRRYNLALDFVGAIEVRERIDEVRDPIMLVRTSEANELLLEAAFELFDDPRLQERLLVEHIDRLKAIEDLISIRADARYAEFDASIRRVTAEIRLLKLRRQMQAAPAK